MLPLPLALPLPQQGTALGRSSTCQDGQAWQLCWSTSWFYRIAPKFYSFMVGRNRNYTQRLFLAIFLRYFSCFLVLPLQMGKEEIGQATCTEQPPTFVYIKIIQKKKMSQWKIISKRAQTFLFPLRLGQQLHLWESPCVTRSKCKELAPQQLSHQKPTPVAAPPQQATGRCCSSWLILGARVFPP